MPVPVPSSRLLQAGRGGERGPGRWEGTGCPQTWQWPGGVHLSSRGPAPRGCPRHDPHSFTLGPKAISGRREKAKQGPSFVWSCKGDLALPPAGMTAARPESEARRVSMTTLWTGVQEAGSRFVPVPSTATVRVPFHTGICPRGPTGQRPRTPGCSWRGLHRPAGPWQESSDAQGLGPASQGPVPNPLHPEREPLKQESGVIFGSFSLNLGGRHVAVRVLCSLNPKDIWGRLSASAA